VGSLVEFVKGYSGINALKFASTAGKVVKLLLDLTTAQLAVTCKVLWAKAVVDHVSDTLAIFCFQQAKGLAIEDTCHTVLLLYEVFQV